MSDDPTRAIAIIGRAGRFPGAPDIDTFWTNLAAGVESIRVLDDDALDRLGVPSHVRRDPRFVAAESTIADVDRFDADFFGLSAREASLWDPQHRVLLECAHQALEDAGYGARAGRGRVGVFASSGLSTYLLHNIGSDPELTAPEHRFHVLYGNDKDFVATKISHRLDLRGPSVNVNSACSSSLLAVHLACNSLLAHETDMALAGAVKIDVTPGGGYFHQDGGIVSPDGHCRAFDAAAAGTVFGSGAGVVVLKRLEDAQRDRDHIHAIVLGSAANNDGANKAGFTAPSVDGQAEVVEEALAMADVDADSIGYVEAHGTGTPVGDPIEVAALTLAFRRGSRRRGYCALGSVKSNLGHLDHAAGMASLFKVIEILERGQIPPSLHLRQPNPRLQLEQTPFYLCDALRHWPESAYPRRAGVNAFGIGGTNVHLVLQQAPVHPPAPRASARRRHVLCLSARTPEALQALSERYRKHLLAADPDETDAADICFTAAVGRTHHRFRRAVSGDDLRELATRLAESMPDFNDAKHQALDPPIAFVFSGSNGTGFDAALNLYRMEPTFRSTFDRCNERIQAALGVSLVAALDARRVSPGSIDDAPVLDAEIVPAALFALQTSLAELWQSWGIKPDAIVGHGLGEYAAACTAGVMTLDDGAVLVAGFGKYLSGLVPAAAADAAVGARRFLAHFALHNASLDSIPNDVDDAFRGIRLNRPRVTMISTVTGQPIDAEIATADYWRRPLRTTGQLVTALRALEARRRGTVVVEIGPNAAPSSDTAGARIAPTPWISSLRASDDAASALPDALGRLYAHGATVDWAAVYRDANFSRCPIPTYPFERQRYWIDAPAKDARPADSMSIGSLLGKNISASGRTMYEVTLDGERVAAFSAGADCTPSFPLALFGLAQLAVASANPTFARARWREARSVAWGPAPELIDGGVRVQIEVAPDDTGAVFEVRCDTHALLRGWFVDEPETLGPSETASEPAQPDFVPDADFAERLQQQSSGLSGVIVQGCANDARVIADIELPRESSTEDASCPAIPLLGFALQLIALHAVGGAQPAIFYPIQIERCEFRGRPTRRCRAELQVTEVAGAYRYTVYDDRGHCVIRADGLRAAVAERGAGDNPAGRHRGSLIARLQSIFAEAASPVAQRRLPSDALADYALDSLALLDVAARVARETGVTLRLSELHGIDRVTELAALLDRRLGETAGTLTPLVSRLPARWRLGELRIERAQRRYTSHFLQLYQSAFGAVPGFRVLKVETDRRCPLEVIVCGSGRPLVFLPPLDSLATAWKHQIATLAATHRAICIHYPGYGRSGFRYEEAQLRAIARTVIETVRSLAGPQPFDIVGWSMGGAIAQWIAIDDPDAISTVALVCTTAGNGAADTIENLVEASARMTGDFRRRDRSPDADPAASTALIKAAYSAETAAHYVDQVLSFDCWDRVAEIRARTLILAGEADSLAPCAHARRLQQAIVGSTLQIHPHGGHYLPLQQPGWVTAQLQNHLGCSTLLPRDSTAI